MTFARPLITAFTFSLVVAPQLLVRADDAPAKINYKDNVAPVFNARCNACHNQDKKKGGLVLDNYTALMQGGASGAVVEAGDPGNSRLYLLVTHEEEPKMPPAAEKLPEAELDIIRKWIEAGAPETSGSVVAMKEKPKLDFKLDPSAVGKPAGAPAMPEGLSTEPLVTSARPNAITALAHSPWAPLAAVAGHKQVLLYNTQTTKLIGVLEFPEGIIETLRFTRDGGLLLAGGGRGGQLGKVVVWDVKTGQRLMEVGNEYDTVLAADISPDRSLVALGGPSKVLRVYDTSTNELVYECKKHTEWVTAVAFSPDGVLLASGDRNGGLLVWEAPNGREFYDLRAHTTMITDVDWRLDSNVLASASEDTTVRLWEMANGTQVKGWGAHGGGVESVRFAKDGRLASTGRDRVAKIWDQNGAVQRQLDAFPDVALQAVFNVDDAALVSGDYTGELRINELAEGKLLGKLVANPPPVATRLAQVSEQISQMQTRIDALSQELAAAETQTASQTQNVAQTQSALDAAQKAAADAQSAHTAADAQYQAAVAAEAATSKAADAASTEAQRIAALRQTAFEELYAKATAAETARVAFATSGSERDRTLLDRANNALLAASDELQAKLPGWALTIAAADPLASAQTQANAACLLIEAALPALALRAEQAQLVVPAQIAARDAAQQAKSAADAALAAKRADLQSAQAALATLKVDAESLAAEKKRLDERQASLSK